MTWGRSSRRTVIATSRPVCSAVIWTPGRASRNRSKTVPGGSATGVSGTLSWVIVSAPYLPALLHDLLLAGHEGGHQRLPARRAAGHVDVHGNDLVHALEDGVVASVGAAVGGAGAHGDDPLGVGHLLVQQLHRRGHLLGDGAGDDHHVRLAGRGPGDDAEAVEVV